MHNDNEVTLSEAHLHGFKWISSYGGWEISTRCKSSQYNQIQKSAAEIHNTTSISHALQTAPPQDRSTRLDHVSSVNLHIFIFLNILFI